MEYKWSSERVSSSESDCESLKSDGSMTTPPFFSNEPVTSDLRLNLLKNPRAKDGLKGWEAKNGGDSWKTENNNKPHPHDRVTKCFMPSNKRISLKRPLKKEGYSDAFLDLQPPIKISDWFAARAEFEILYQMYVELLDQNKKTIRTCKSEKVVFQPWNDEPWCQVTHIFEEDKPGVQFIRGKDTQFWKGCVDHCGEFRSTAELHKYACDLTLDPNTANSYLILSEENRKITYVKDHQSYPDHPERFDDVPQVLCGESLTGRCYWEIEWSGHAEISVTYKGISRKGGRDCWFGFNDKSWSLFCSNNRFTVWHNLNFTDIPVIRSSSKRVGVYVDVSAGTLSFYSVSDTHTLTHLHTFNTTFTEPLYAGFTLHPDSSVSLCDIKQQTHTLADTDFFYFE